MAEYQRSTQRFTSPGLSTRPRGIKKEGRQDFHQNLRQVTPGTLETRAGLRVLTSAPFGNPVHSLFRLNDTTIGNALRLVGSGSNLYGAHPADPQAFGAAIDTGYGGVEYPLTAAYATPIGSSRPYAYLTDGTRQRKVNADPTVYPIGIPAPVGPPSVTVEKPLYDLVHLIDGAGAFTQVGGSATVPATISRVNTTVGSIYYDSGSAGYCDIFPVDPSGITVGMLLTIGAETVVVEQILLAVASTTIASIVYDSGTTGPCAIAPTGGLGTGSVEDAPLTSYLARNPKAFYGQFPIEESEMVPVGSPAPTPTLPLPPEPTPLTPRRTRTVDFPVNAMVTLNGTETVRILSIAVDRDGIASFRCVTAGSFSAGQTIAGVGPGIRVSTVGTLAAGNAISAHAVRHTLNPILVTVGGTMTGGLKATQTVDLSKFGNNRPVTAEDIIRIQIRVDDLTRVETVRVYLDVDRTANNFLQNYYFFEWRSNDIISAIQATNSAEVAPIVSAMGPITLVGVPGTIFGQLQLPANLIPTTPTVPLLAADDPSRRYLATQTPVDAATAAIFSQLALGNNQWLNLECKVGQLIRVGTDTGQSLAAVKAFEILVRANAVISSSPLTIDYNNLYLTGGYGPDVGQVGDPYVYRYRYRSSVTGEVSNPSPASRGGAIARRQAVDLAASASSSPQADLIDWFRIGSGLGGRYSYVMTTANAGATVVDDLADGAITGGATLDFLDFQPWVTLQARQTGTCTVAGNAIKRTSGPTFDSTWATGTLVLINNKACTLDQVISTDVLFVVENGGAGSVTYVIPEPQKVGQPLPVFFMAHGGFLFAVGDPLNPGTLYWARPGNPDSHSDQNSLVVTSGTDPLVGGIEWDNATYLFSTRRQFEIVLQSDGTFRAVPTACEKGLRSHKGLARTPHGIFFVSDDGIYLTRGGSEPVSITDEDLKEIFPVDQAGQSGSGGGIGRSVGLVPTPEISGRARDLRLAYVDGLLYFDYEISSPEDTYRSLVYDPKEGIWFFDRYPGDHEIVRLDEEAEGEGTDTAAPAGRSRRHLVAVGPQIALFEGTQDLGSPISWIWYSAQVDLGDTRSVKQWGDAILDLDPKGTTVTVTPVFDEAATVDPAQTNSGTGRQTWVIPIRDGAGALSRTMGLRASGSTATGLVLYLWEPAALAKVEDATRRATDWDDLGSQQAKFVQGIIIRADTHGADKTLLVQGDRNTFLTLTINHNGEKEVAYPIASTGWTPFIAHLVRLWPSGDDDTWLLLGARWVWEPAPEFATEWTTQSTSHDLPGYLHVRDAFFSYSDAANPITFEIIYDGVSISTTITPPNTSYQRVYTLLPARKGRSVSYRWKSTTPFRLYRKDTAVRVHSWGDPRGYQIAMPFGGESRLNGAEV